MSMKWSHGLCVACGKRHPTPIPDELTPNGAAPEIGQFCDECRTTFSEREPLSAEDRAAVNMAKLYGVPVPKTLARAASRARGDLDERGLLLPGIEKRRVKKAQRSIRDDEDQAAEVRAKAEGKSLADLARERGVSDSAARMSSLRRKRRLKARR